MTHAEQMVAKIEEALLANPLAEEVTLGDGVRVRFAEATKRLEYWKTQVALETGARPRLSRINLTGH